MLVVVMVVVVTLVRVLRKGAARHQEAQSGRQYKCQRQSIHKPARKHWWKIRVDYRTSAAGPP